MKNLHISALVCLILIISCNHNVLPFDSDSYYPLQLGNEWHYYALESDSSIFKVDSTSVINDQTYFVISSVLEPEIAGLLLREKDGIVYRVIEGQEYLYLDFTRNIGESWQELPYARTSHIISKTDTVYTNNGMVVDCIKIISESSLDIIEQIYAPGIGLIHSNIELKDGIIIGGTIGLIWAVINDNVVRIENQ